MSVRRVYVEKKPDFAVAAKDLAEEIKSYLSIDSVDKVRVLIRYDVENVSDVTYMRPWARFSPSRRWIFYMRRISPERKGTGCSPWSTCPASTTREPIPPSSA